MTTNADYNGYVIAVIKTQVATAQECKILHENILAEMLLEDFYGMWHYVTAYGIKPVSQEE